MKRIMIIGFSGSGKSSLARRLGERLGIEPVHLDQLHWLPGWVENTLENKQKRLLPVLEQERWIIEGNYRNLLFKERLSRCDTLIFMSYPRVFCLVRVCRRFLAYRGKTRPDMTEGCPEKIDREFIKWVLLDGRKNQKPYDFLLRSCQDKKACFRFTNDRQVEKFLENISRSE